MTGMSFSRRTTYYGLAGALATAAALAACNDKPVAADNTKKNERDVAGSADKRTPMDQGQNGADIDITAKIRRDLMGNDSLSSNAKNVKIITESGKVTLRGPVQSEDERTQVVSAAQHVVGAEKVDNQIEIAR